MPVAEPKLELKNPFLAGMLAWALPGLGHLYQGRVGKALLFFVSIMGLFIAGLHFSGGRVVYFRWDESEWRLPYFAQLGVGLPAVPALFDPLEVRPAFAKLFPRYAEYLSKPLTHQELDQLCRRSGAVAPQDDKKKEAEALREKGLGYVVTHDEVDELHRTLGRQMDVALIYTMVAGLLNILVIYDAAAGPANYEEDEMEPQEAGRGEGASA